MTVPHPGVADPAFDQPRFEGEPRAYLICTTRRSGSTLLSDLLRRTGQFGVPAEYLHGTVDHDLITPLARRFGTMDDDSGKLAIDPYLVELVRHRTTPNGVFGMKLHYDHLVRFYGFASFRRLVRSARVVWLTREDRIDQAISLSLALLTGEWVRLPGARHGAPRQVPPFDRNLFERALGHVTHQNLQWEAFFAETGIRRYHVTYEQVVDDPGAVVGAMAAYVGVGDVPTVTLAEARPIRQSGAANAAWRAVAMRSLGRRG